MKEYREKEMKFLMISYLLLFFLLCTDGFVIIDLNPRSLLETIFPIAESMMVASVISLFVYIADSLISSSYKDKLVGFFFIPKAGCVIFSKINSGKQIDDRFMIIDAQKQYESIIQKLGGEPKANRIYENSQWYKIYCKYQDKGAVNQTQKDYLLCRDLYIESIMFLTLYFAASLVLSEWVKFSLAFIIILSSIAIITNITTHMKMNRFVNTVVALDIAISNK